jgi:predicted CXXCH cytochrome family protein
MSATARRKRWAGGVTIGAAVVAITACAIAFWAARWRVLGEPASRAEALYQSGQWAAAAELARQGLSVRKDDPAALRLLARASARLGRATAALAIYERRLGESQLEAEDQLLLGVILELKGQPDAAARAWKKALDIGKSTPGVLEELGRLHVHARRWDDALRVTDRLSGQPGWEARGSMMLGTIRAELNNVPGAALSFGHALKLDPAEVDKSHEPIKLRKLIARTFLRVAQPDQARAVLQPLLDAGPDGESSWLMSRIYLQQGDKALAVAALRQAGSYRAANPLEPEPSPYVGEARCEKCHETIVRDSFTSRHTHSYYRGAQLDTVPLPGRPLADPDDPEVSHSFQRRDGVLREETRVGRAVFEAVVEYAFGTSDRFLTMVSHDAAGLYHIARLSYYDTPEGKGWDRSPLDKTHPTRGHPADFQGEPIGVRDGLARCLYCHVTNPRTGHDAIGPETADHAIGCERCHGPGGNHILALQTGFPDLAIANPAGASPATVTARQCNDCHILDKNFREGDMDDPGWARSQGVGWTLSRCNTESGGAFGCVTCHNPHQSARATSTAEYELRCLSCHGATSPPDGKATPALALAARAGAERSFRPCPVSPAKGCLECHMPRVRIDSLHMDLADHNIRIPRQKRGKAIQ